MAKQSKSETLGLLAFVAILFNVIAWAISLICSAFNITFAINGRSVPSLLTGIASLLLLIVVLFVAWDYVKKLSKGWRIFFIVVAIISLLAVFFGVGYNFLG